MKNKKMQKYVTWLLAFATVFWMGSIGNSTEVMAKSKKAAVVKSVSLKIGNKKVTKKTFKIKRGDRKKSRLMYHRKKVRKL